MKLLILILVLFVLLGAYAHEVNKEITPIPLYPFSWKAFIQISIAVVFAGLIIFSFFEEKLDVKQASIKKEETYSKGISPNKHSNNMPMREEDKAWEHASLAVPRVLEQK